MPMKKTLFLLVLTFVAARAASESRSGIPVTRWIDDGSGSRPGTYAEWRQANPVTPACKIVRRTTLGRRLDTKCDVIVNSVLYDSIAPALDTLGQDLTQEGYAVSVFTMAGGTPESLHTFLQHEYDSSLAGALLIGNLPVAWYQLIDDWNGNGKRDTADGDAYDEFPCDLYYMDLDGVWLDTMHRLSGHDSLVPGSDGIFDQHSGDMAPEIWVGRITTRPCGNEPSLVNSYLRKDHAYRTGGIALNDRALVFIDDDWVPWADEFHSDMQMLYPNAALISDPETTQTTKYRQCLGENYQWVGLYSHSSSHVHAMKYNSGNSWSWMYESEIPGLNPVANFYNLFCCSNARFTDTGYMAGRYIYSSTTGLNSVGSTKTGSMLDFQYFYSPMGAGERIGEAFRDWFAYEASGGFTPDQRSWFYGMCLNGDPTLKPRLPPAHDVGVSGITAPNGTVDSGASIVPVCQVTNYGLNDETFDVRFRIGTTYDQMRGKTLARGATDTVAFPVWIAGPCGSVALHCSTALSSDVRPENDTLSGWATVREPAGITGTEDQPGLARLSVEPNPLSLQTVIRYSLPFAAQVKLTVYDCQGARVGILAQGFREAGAYSLRPTLLSSLPSGIYVLRLEAGDKTETRRLTVIR
jgi:hypothetical protein